MKKLQKILNELNRRKDLNNKYCEQNSCSPTKYMEGSNDTLNKMIEFVEDLQQKKKK